MSLRTSATRYARALLEVAAKESDPVRIGDELESFVGAITQDREASQALLSPRVAPASKVNAIRALAERAGLSAPLAKLLVMLAERGRLELLPALLEVYRERLLAHQNIIRAAVTSATPMSSDTVEKLERRLSDVTGKQVQLAASVDADLIGGIVTRIGSTVYDGSVKTQLQKMKQQLIDNA